MTTAPARVVLLIVAFLGILNAQPAARPAQSATPGITTQALPTSPTRPTDTEILLKYQEFLRKESQASADQLEKLVQHTETVIYATAICVVALVLCFGFVGIRSYKDGVNLAIKSNSAKVTAATEEAMGAMRATGENTVKKMQAELRAEFEKRMAVLERIHERRQFKYYKLFRDYYSTAFEAMPGLKERFVGCEFTNGVFARKRILWVEDDAVGIAFYVHLLESCQLAIKIVPSTQAALQEPLSAYDLIISNLRREPDDNAGLLLAQKIRQKQSRMPIIIFTRQDHGAFYKDSIEEISATSMATSQAELFAQIVRDLSPKPEGAS